MLRRFLRRFLEVLLGHLPIETVRDCFSMPQPRCRHMRGILIGEFGRPRRSHVLPGFWPGLQAGRKDVPDKLRPQISRRVPVSRDDVLCARLSLIENCLEERHQLRKNRRDADAAVKMMRRFWTVYGKAKSLPVYIRPP